MYNLPEFKEKDPGLIRSFMREHPFALITGCADSKPVATQVPLLISEENGQILLRGHIMKGTDHHKAFLANEAVLCVFTGPHTYVSASWYTNPQTGSTWNYMSVHARGALRFLDNTSLINILRETTTLFENDEHSPASFDQLPEEYVQRLAKAISAFEIRVTSLEHVFKLSQNRDAESYRNITGKLQQGSGDARAIAAEMQRRDKDLFPSK